MQSNRRGACEVDNDVGNCMAKLEREVLNWMHTYRAWDERKHPAILQYIKDIREHCSELHEPGGLTVAAISMELHRLDTNLRDAEVNIRIAELQRALSVDARGRS